MTLLEIVISAAIVSLLALVIMTATVPLSNTGSETAIALDMDRMAQKVMAELRKDIRQTGYTGTTAKFGCTSLTNNTAPLAATGGANQMKMALRIDETAWGDNVTTQAITWGLVSDTDGTHIYRQVGTGAQNRMLSQVHAVTDPLGAGLVFAVAANDQVCQVTIRMSRSNNAGQTITRTYIDRIEMMNRRRS